MPNWFGLEAFYFGSRPRLIETELEFGQETTYHSESRPVIRIAEVMQLYHYVAHFSKVASIFVYKTILLELSFVRCCARFDR